MPEKKSAAEKRVDKKTTKMRQAYSPPVKSEARQVDYCRVVKGVVVCGY